MAVIAMREALNQALREEMTRDGNVFVMGEDIGVFEGSYKVTAGLLKEFGERRVVDTPIAEEAIIGTGIGAAMLGLRPVLEIMTINFILVAMDQVVNHAAKIRYMFGGEVGVPVTIRTPGGGGQQLTAQHSQSLEVFFAHVPGLRVVAPSTPKDAKGMLKAAIRDDNPVIFIENISLYNTRGEVPDEEYLIPLDKAEIKRPGRDITFIGHSKGTLLALEAADRLAQEGIEAEVLDLRSLRPLDCDAIVESVKRTHRAVLVEEGWPTYGITAEVSATLMEHAFDYLDAPVKRVGGIEVPMPYSKPLENAVIPSVERVLEAARSIL
ncbi:MAG: alpha-ketoacid dehydrogenase subunit beta [Dehalococcoidia bacterium]|nr:alpha-ketoacid dehydrogenase subunit beta [Dehalococcoidia bacterium]